MKKKVVLAVAAIIVVLVISSTVIAYNYWYHSRPIDTSWVDTVNQMVATIQPTPPYSNNTDITDANVMLAGFRVYLYENGTEKLIDYQDSWNYPHLGSYLSSLLERVDVQLNSVSKEFLNRVLASDKVVLITFRTDGYSGRFYKGYFVLEDNLNDGIAGKVIAQEMFKQDLNLWGIPK